MLNARDAADDPHYKARGLHIEWEDEQVGRLKGVGAVPKFSKTPQKIWRGSPLRQTRPHGPMSDGLSAAHAGSGHNARSIGSSKTHFLVRSGQGRATGTPWREGAARPRALMRPGTIFGGYEAYVLCPGRAPRPGSVKSLEGDGSETPAPQTRTIAAKSVRGRRDDGAARGLPVLGTIPSSGEGQSHRPLAHPCSLRGSVSAWWRALRFRSGAR